MVKQADITPVTAIPGVGPDDATLAGKVFTTTANSVDLYGRCTAGSGTVNLLWWDGVDWYPLDGDKNNSKGVAVDSAGAFGGRFHAPFAVGDTSGRRLVVYVAGGATLNPCRLLMARY